MRGIQHSEKQRGSLTALSMDTFWRTILYTLDRVIVPVQITDVGVPDYRAERGQITQLRFLICKLQEGNNG